MERFSTDKNTINFPNSFGGRNLKQCLGIVHRLVERQGFEDLALNFRDCISVYESAMVPLIAYLDFIRKHRNIDIDLYLPTDRKVAAIFLNAGWAHFLAPANFEMRESRSVIHSQLASYKTADEQYAVVDKLLSVLLNSMQIDRDHLNAIEWSLNEITDNVLNHAGEGAAGYIQSLKYSDSNVIEFIVADAGIGIPKSLAIGDHNEALEKSIQQGVTRDKKTNQGNGLYGSFNIARVAKGQFNIQSYFGNLFLTEDGKVKYRREEIPYHGTFVRWSINCKEGDIIRRALKFGDRQHEISFGYIEKTYGEDVEVAIVMKQEFKSFRSRDAGKLAFNRLSNLLVERSRALIVDFQGVDVISSSFADEVFGRIFKKLGAINFGRYVNFRNLNAEVAGLIDRAIAQRAATPD